MWYALDSGFVISGKVMSDKYKPSSLFQRWLEISIKVFISWSDEKSITILQEKIKRVNYPCDMDYVDDSKTLLKDFLVERIEEGEEEVEVCETSECDSDQRA